MHFRSSDQLMPLRVSAIGQLPVHVRCDCLYPHHKPRSTPFASFSMSLPEQEIETAEDVMLRADIWLQ
jgi:hypothetical protein